MAILVETLAVDYSLSEEEEGEEGEASVGEEEDSVEEEVEGMEEVVAHMDLEEEEEVSMGEEMENSEAKREVDSEEV